MRVLFVDDDPSVLAGLERVMFLRAADWDMTFVEHGRHALAALEERAYDAVVSDLHLADMDGVDLVHRIATCHPGVVRVILSATTEPNAIAKTAPHAHQFLAKPATAETIQSTIERACLLRDVLGSAEVRDAVGGVGALPTRPAVYHQLCQALLEPDVELPRLVQIVSEDVALSAKVLHLVNSSFVGLRHGIQDLSRAVGHIGPTMLKNLVLSHEVFSAFDDVDALDLDAEHRHALGAAGLARRFFGQRDAADEAFLATMLHDIGMLVLASRMPERWRRATILAEADGRDAVEAEYEVFGASHAEVGAHLLSVWGFSVPVVEAVAFHHRPEALGSGPLNLARAVWLADALMRGGATVDASALAAQAGVDVDQVERWREVAEGSASS